MGELEQPDASQCVVSAKEAFCRELEAGIWTNRCDQLAADYVCELLGSGSTPAMAIGELVGLGLGKKDASKLVRSMAETGGQPSAQNPNDGTCGLLFKVATVRENNLGQRGININGRGRILIKLGEAVLSLRVQPSFWIRAVLQLAFLIVAGAFIRATGLRTPSGIVCVIALCPILVFIRFFLTFKRDFRLEPQRNNTIIPSDGGIVSFQLDDGQWLNLWLDGKRDDSASRLFARALMETYLGQGQQGHD